jgi:hypothetical protein
MLPLYTSHIEAHRANIAGSYQGQYVAIICKNGVPYIAIIPQRYGGPYAAITSCRYSGPYVSIITGKYGCPYIPIVRGIYGVHM